MRSPALLLPLLLCLSACTPPLKVLRAKRVATLSVTMEPASLLGAEDAAQLERLRSRLEEEIVASLAPEVQILAPEAAPRAPHIDVALLRPERAEVPGLSETIQRAYGDRLTALLTLGLAPERLEDRMARLGVDPERFRQAQKEAETDDLFTWGPMETRAKRAKLEALGYAPLLFQGRYRITEDGGRKGLGDGILLGWEAVPCMDPLPPEARSEARIVEASLRGLARRLRARWAR